MAVAALEPLLSDAGWAYASLPPQEPGDPGRFHALFGRDSLITALQVLPEAPEVAVATLRALAALQGRADDPATDEEPGKILHEYRPVAEPRFAAAGWPVRDGELRYYGSADSTSWFLVVLAALQDDGLAAELADARRRAGEWLARALDAGGGLVRYGPRRAPGGLAHQGWRDATAPVSEHSEGSGIVRPDGSDPEPPLADADCQAAAHAALRALARLDPDGDWDARAAALRARVGEAFAPGADWALAIEADGTAVPGAGSQLGWLLWAGALEPEPRRPPRRSGSPRPTCSRRTGCARSPPAIPRSGPATTTAAGSGRSTRGSAGAGCAPRGWSPRRSGSGPACSTRSTGSAGRRSCTRSRRPGRSRRSRSPTASRPGRSARAGRSSTAGTGAHDQLPRSGFCVRLGAPKVARAGRP